LVGFILGKKEARRGPRGSERRGWRWAGPAGGQGLVGREAGGWAWEKGGGPREEEGGAGRLKAKAQVAGPKTGDGPKLKKKFFLNFN
jgi:hypothetical protein